MPDTSRGAPKSISYNDLLAVIESRGKAGRSLTALAGPPGSGKSTLAERMVDDLNQREPGSAAVVPMDGFHFDDIVLEARGLRARKGAPDTFDAAGFWHLLARLKQNAEPEIAIPVFDRTLEISRAGARLIDQKARHLIVEGNYLLLNHGPWARLFDLFATTVMLQTDIATLTERLTSRWLGFGLEDDAIDAKVNGNDLPNGQRIIADSRNAEFALATGESATMMSRARPLKKDGCLP